MSRCRRREPVYRQEKQYSASYSPEEFKQCKKYRAFYDPGEDGREWRQEKTYCMRFGRSFRSE